MLRQIAIKDDCVEQIEHWLSWERCDEVREISSVRNYPDRHDRRLTTGRSGQSSWTALLARADRDAGGPLARLS
jgi:hypothetical protein